MSRPQAEPLAAGAPDVLSDWQRLRRELAIRARAAVTIADRPPLVPRATRDAVGEARLTLLIHHERLLGRAFVQAEADRVRRELGLRSKP